MSTEEHLSLIHVSLSCRLSLMPLGWWTAAMAFSSALLKLLPAILFAILLLRVGPWCLTLALLTTLYAWLSIVTFPPNFHIFQIVRNEMSAEVGTNIYSSKTGEWSYKDGAWNHGNFTTSHVFHHVMMHCVGSSVIMAVDTEGKTRKIPLPDDTNFRDKFGDVGQSQGHLYYISQRGSNLEASVWFLENYDADEWTLKHSVNVAQLLNVGNQRVYAYDYIVISGHPDCSLIYFADFIHNLLMAYDVGRNEVHEADVFGSFGQGTLKPAFPYVALYKETLV